MTKQGQNKYGTPHRLKQVYSVISWSHQGTDARPHHRSPSYAARVLAFLDKQSQAFVLALVVLYTTVLLVVDYLTGFHLSLALFYLVPIALTAWTLGRNAGLGWSLLCALLWLATNYVAGEVVAHPPGILVWDTITRVGFFVSVTLLLSGVKHTLDIERLAARTDDLTRAINRRAFHDVALIEMQRLQRHQRPFTVAYIDVDNFKSVNDSLGHSVGDLLLQTLVSTIAEHLRTVDTVARLGGDEFAILLPETDAQAAPVVIHRLCHCLLSEMRRHDWPVTFSVGVVTYYETPSTIDDLIGIADTVMYDVKNNQKDAITYTVYTGQRENSVGA